jgi:hypothetical protein
MTDESVVHMLTTVDNPFNPFTHFDEWNNYDMQSGHHTLALLGRIVVVGDDETDAQARHATELAIDEIVSDNFSGVHKKVAKPKS